MADNPQNAHPKSGPWVGVDETGQGGPNHVVGSLNVVFRDGAASRRPGRRIIGTLPGGARRICGIFEAVSASGLREVLVMADPLDPIEGADLKLYRFVQRDGSFTEITMEGLGGESPAGDYAAFVPFLGHAIIATPGGKLIDYDGARAALLVAMAGLDAGTSAESYLAAPPTAKMLAVWRNRIAASGDPLSPTSIGLSEDDQAIAIVPPTAPVGGPNVWPGSTQFAVLADDGDEPMGLTVLNDRLVVPCRACVAVVDEDSVAPFARITSRGSGCVAPRSIVNVGNLVIYLGDGAVLAFNGEVAGTISGEIAPTLDPITGLVDWSSAHRAVAVHLRHQKEYRLWVPTKYDSRNSYCLIYNYARQTWRMAAADYPWMAASTYPFDVTAAATVLLDGVREQLLTGDSSGNLWLEDSGTDDQGEHFPAYLLIAPIEMGAEVETYRDWRVDCLHDGSPIGGVALVDGRSHEQELWRIRNGELTAGGADEDIPYVLSVARRSGAQTWTSITAWPVDFVGPVYDDLKLGLSARGRKLQPLLLLPASANGVTDPAPGGIRQLEVSLRARDGRRA